MGRGILSYPHRPKYEAPVELRCEALVKGKPNYAFVWMRHDHRCPRKANQMRGPHQVCWQHAQMKRVEYFNERRDKAP